MVLTKIIDSETVDGKIVWIVQARLGLKTWTVRRNYKAFNGKVLDPKYYLEFNPNLEFCDLSLHTHTLPALEFKIFPIPSHGVLNIQNDDIIINEISVYNRRGDKVELIGNLNSHNYSINTSRYKGGLYFFVLNNMYIYKVLVIN